MFRQLEHFQGSFNLAIMKQCFSITIVDIFYFRSIKLIIEQLFNVFVNLDHRLIIFGCSRILFVLVEYSGYYSIQLEYIEFDVMFIDVDQIIFMLIIDIQCIQTLIHCLLKSIQSIVSFTHQIVKITKMISNTYILFWKFNSIFNDWFY